MRFHERKFPLDFIAKIHQALLGHEDNMPNYLFNQVKKLKKALGGLASGSFGITEYLTVFKQVIDICCDDNGLNHYQELATLLDKLKKHLWFKINYHQEVVNCFFETLLADPVSKFSLTYFFLDYIRLNNIERLWLEHEVFGKFFIKLNDLDLINVAREETIDLENMIFMYYIFETKDSLEKLKIELGNFIENDKIPEKLKNKAQMIMFGLEAYSTQQVQIKFPHS